MDAATYLVKAIAFGVFPKGTILERAFREETFHRRRLLAEVDFGRVHKRVLFGPRLSVTSVGYRILRSCFVTTARGSKSAFKSVARQIVLWM